MLNGSFKLEDIGALTYSYRMYKGLYTDDFGNNKAIRIKIREIDSSLKAKAGSGLGKSEIVKLLKSIPYDHQNGSTKELLKYYLDNSKEEKDGVVLIIW